MGGLSLEYIVHVQLTPGNSDLQGKLKKFQIIRSSEQVTGNNWGKNRCLMFSNSCSAHLNEI